MNQPRVANDCPPRPAGAPLARRGPLVGALLAVLAASGFAQSPPPSGIDRLVLTDARRLLADEDPTVRGEAAVIVGAGARRSDEARLLELASDAAPEARQRALLGLGLMASPLALQHLEGILDSVDGRGGDDGVVAAYALGIAPLERVGTAAARTLSLFPRGSWQRQHDALQALLLGMLQCPERRETAALRRLLDDDGNRDDDIRALLLELLLPTTPGLDDDELAAVLRRGSAAERRAVLAWFAVRRPADNKPWLDELQRIARRDQDAGHRSYALEALTRLDHLPALDLATRALRSRDPAEAAQGVRTIFALGGASCRGPVAEHLIGERDPQRKAALLDAYLAPPPPQLIEHAVALATDGGTPITTRVAAARLVANGTPERSLTLLRDLFRSVDEPSLLIALASTLHRVESEPTPLVHLLPRPDQLSEHPRRWRALLLQGDDRGHREVLACLRDTTRDPSRRRRALSLWRSVVVLPPPATDAPKVLRTLLAPTR